MILKAVTWNIGGGKVRLATGDVSVLSSYNNDGMSAILETLRSIEPDIISLQEVHRDENSNQAELIAKELGFEYITSDFYAESHIEEGQELGQAIISRYPILDERFEFFNNPKWEVTWEDGSIATTHDKGITSIRLKLENTIMTVKTLHAIPFRRFNIDPFSDEAQPILEDMEAKMKPIDSPLLIQGDFNLDEESLHKAFRSTLREMSEVEQTVPTTPKGRKLDHVLYKGLKLISSKPDDSVLTDHFPVVSEFELEV